ncbi:aspartyl-tRNA amidotransferase [Sporanaerobium hydrogeniformans]|uniref:Aspartyl-tRNA amidotransferase n=1 Tax=Sporanaerobium hydrogeniformans TaxID=3072179 RepID=A0AC61DCN2_9FIRM|nr:GatB/YqeY domain-containing protein [Sporanaerobium hydrogeniformans]PHV70655.1 aspartyl-tRNA amidotransferase [Sporanaerobium hydrogeniformans]
MSLKEKFLSDMKEAMKEKNVLRKNTIQLVRAAVLQKEKDTLQEVSDEQILDILVQEVKKRKDALIDFKKAERQDLIEETEAELAVLSTYMPQQFSEEDLLKIIQKIIGEVGATSMKDMGKVMTLLTPQVKGRADSSQVSRIVKECLTKQ